MIARNPVSGSGSFSTLIAKVQLYEELVMWNWLLTEGFLGNMLATYIEKRDNAKNSARGR